MFNEIEKEFFFIFLSGARLIKHNIILSDTLLCYAYRQIFF